MASYENDPEYLKWKQHIEDELIPMIEESAVSVTIASDGKPDVKLAVELGLSILLDKPIILARFKGATIPPKLALVADEVVDFGKYDDVEAQAFQEAMSRIVLRKQGVNVDD